MKNQECKVRPEIINVNSNETVFFTFNIKPSKCRLDASVCNSKQGWNKDKCRCECKELIDKGICDKGFIWNSNNCEC